MKKVWVKRERNQWARKKISIGIIGKIRTALKYFKSRSLKAAKVIYFDRIGLVISQENRFRTVILL